MSGGRFNGRYPTYALIITNWAGFVDLIEMNRFSGNIAMVNGAKIKRSSTRREWCVV